MARAKISGPRLVLYLLYGVLLTCALLVVRFPKEKFLQYAEKKIEASFPGSRVRLNSLDYAFPVSAALGRAQISQIESGEDIVLLQDMTITPTFSGMNLGYSISGSVLGGGFRTNLTPVIKDKRYILDDLELTGLDLSRSAYISRIFRRDIEGTLNFKGRYSGSLAGKDSAEKIACKGFLEIERGSFVLRQPVLTLKTMEFDSLNGELTMQDGVVTLSEGVMDGVALKADFDGLLIVAGNPLGWRIDLEGAIVPDQEFLKGNPQLVRVVGRLQKQYKKNALPYSVSGTVADPRFRFGGKDR